ncbi:Hypothetical predicted protein [Mytilus galloprovincialis]|uniref:Tc1-like transposase DDE domain-containing protein n=1 Tax=Mytilus galloprovincialis TaxID=29158 RepID=A0A8B6G6P4_MYTGA|nr:Hypothetical predicted protein [Mytilus galloprovincialis]
MLHSDRPPILKLWSWDVLHIMDDNLWQVVTKHFSNEPYLFQDDNAPCHRSRLVEEWKRQNQIPQLTWPAQSPDLSLIENVRPHLVRNVKDIKSELLPAWLEVPLFYIQGLYSTSLQTSSSSEGWHNKILKVINLFYEVHGVASLVMFLRRFNMINDV